MNGPFIADTVFNIGVNDKELDLFGGQSPAAGGVSCNSYVILDERTAVIHPVNERISGPWLLNLEQVMDGEPVDYLIVSHAEPGYAAAIRAFMNKYPEAKLVGNASAVTALGSGTEEEFEGRILLISEGNDLELGHHVLQFYMIPSEQRPEVMAVYESMEELLFSADKTEEYGKWTEECLERTEDLPIQMICPMYGCIRESTEPSGSMANHKEHTSHRKSGFWKMFSGVRVG